MQEHFLTYEQSLAVKELGFDEPCFMSYNPNNNFWDNYCTNSQLSSLNGNNSIVCSAPLKSQFFRWVREKYQIYSHIERIGANNTFEYWIKNKSKAFDTYEQAEDACINKIIELLKLK